MLPLSPNTWWPLWRVCVTVKSLPEIHCGHLEWNFHWRGNFPFNTVETDLKVTVGCLKVPLRTPHACPRTLSLTHAQTCACAVTHTSTHIQTNVHQAMRRIPLFDGTPAGRRQSPLINLTFTLCVQLGLIKKTFTLTFQ